MDSIFSSSFKSFVHISSDNRVHLWDVESRKEKNGYVDKNHLSHLYTSFDWYQQSSDSLGTFAAGFSDGLVVVWDFTRGIVVKTIGKQNDSPVPTAIAFSSDGKSIFISSTGNQVAQYAISTGELLNNIKVGKKGASKIAINPKANVLAASSSSIKLIEIESGDKRKLDASFSGGVSVMKFSNCGRYLIAASNKSREVLVFDIQVDAPETPIHVITVPGIVVNIDLKSIVQQSAMEILCIYEDNCGGSSNTNGTTYNDSNNNKNNIGASYIRLSMNYRENEKTGANSILSTTHIATSTTKQQSNIINGYIIRNNNSNNSWSQEVGLVVGSKTSPVFTSLFVEKDGKVLSTVRIRELPLSHNNNEHTIETNRQTHQKSRGGDIEATMLLQTPDVLGPHEMGGQKRPLIAATSETEVNNNVNNEDSSSSSKKNKKIKTSSSSLDPESTLLSSISNNDHMELTLEQKLQQLSSQLHSIEEGEEGDSNNNTVALSSIPKQQGTASAAPTSDSLVTLIEQSLQSNDDILLESCLACQDISIIDATAARLPTSRIVIFLRKLVAKFEKRPSRGILLTHWLSSLLRHHTSYLITVSDLSFQLASLNQILEQRLSSYTKLTSLAGRLDLLLAQVTYPGDSNNNNKNNNNTVVNSAITNKKQQQKQARQQSKPMQVYNEEESDAVNINSNNSNSSDNDDDNDDDEEEGSEDYDEEEEEEDDE